MKDPSDEAILAARIQRAYPQLGPYQSASLARDLGKIERAQRRHAERQCNGPPDVRRRAERGEVSGYVKLRPMTGSESQDPTAPKGKAWDDDHEAEARAIKSIRSAIDKWSATVGEMLCYAKGENAALLSRDEWICRSHAQIELEGDPRGAVLKIRFPGETEARSA